MRRFFALLMTLGLMAAGSAAGEEIVSPSTPTDLCPHEHTREILYFDYPEYYPLNDFTHVIRGSAIVNTVCPDCGQVVRSEARSDAELIRPHTFKRGVCVLCGRPEPRQVAPPEEECRTVTLSADALTPPDGESHVEIRMPEAGTALVFPAMAVKVAMKNAGESLVIRIKEEEDRVFTSVSLGSSPLRMEGVRLRVYSQQMKNIFFSGTEEDSASVAETAEWTAPDGGAEGYSEAAWIGNGYYIYIEE